VVQNVLSLLLSCPGRPVKKMRSRRWLRRRRKSREAAISRSRRAVRCGSRTGRSTGVP